MYLQTCMHACIHPYRLGVDHPEHPDSFGRGWEGPAGGGKAFSVSTCPRNERAHVARARTHTHTHTGDDAGGEAADAETEAAATENEPQCCSLWTTQHPRPCP